MRKSRKSDSISTYLGPNGSVEGTIEFKNTIRLDGNVKGKIISSSGTVVIGERAVVNAQVNVDTAVVMGRFNGTIDARKRIELYPPGRIVGDIHAPTILIESGVVFNGNCSMKARTLASATPPQATESTKNSPNSKEIQT